MFADPFNRDFILDGLRKSVEALASPGETALPRMPDGSVKADELALDFDNFGPAALETLGSEMTELQRESLQDIDRLLAAMSGSHQAHLGLKKQSARIQNGTKCGRQPGAQWSISVSGNTLLKLPPAGGHLRRYTRTGLADVSFPL